MTYALVALALVAIAVYVWWRLRPIPLPATPTEFYQREIAPILTSLDVEDVVGDQFAYGVLYSTLRGNQWRDRVAQRFDIKEPRFGSAYSIRRGGIRFALRFEQPRAKRQHSSRPTKQISQSTLFVEVSII